MNTLASQSARLHRMCAIALLGFASGLPLALTGQAMQAWLAMDGVSITTIGFFGLVGTPYTFKFLWAPLMDRFEPPWFGRRRGWLMLCQWALGGLLLLMAQTSPLADPLLFAFCALCVAFLSASQDIVVDAYRTDLLPENERGLGASLHVFSYRLAMIVSGGVALIWAEQWHSWGKVYALMGSIFGVLGCFSLLALPRLKNISKPLNSNARDELRGFSVMLVGITCGALLAHRVLRLIGLEQQAWHGFGQLVFVFGEIFLALLLAWWFSALATPQNRPKPQRQIALCGLGAVCGLYLSGEVMPLFITGGASWLIGALLTLFCAWLFARLTRFETLNASLTSYFALPGALRFLILIILYKLGDAFAGSLSTVFLLNAMHFLPAEIGIANKLIGLWLTILGALIGGSLMLRIGLYRAILWFGVLQLASNFGFIVMLAAGRDAWGSVALEPFNWGFIALDQAISLDYLLLTVIGIENITGGMGTVALVALLMSLCKQRFSATHYALLSALAAVGRIYVSPVSGVLIEQIGWHYFYLFSILIGLPGLYMVWNMRNTLRQLGDEA